MIYAPGDRKKDKRRKTNFHECDFARIFTGTLIFFFSRTSNMYADPQPIVRPINHLSWSPGAQNRLAAAYSFMEFERKLSNVNPSSYIWDIGIKSLCYRITIRILPLMEHYQKMHVSFAIFFCKGNLFKNLIYFIEIIFVLLSNIWKDNIWWKWDHKFSFIIQKKHCLLLLQYVH